MPNDIKTETEISFVARNGIGETRVTGGSPSCQLGPSHTNNRARQRTIKPCGTASSPAWALPKYCAAVQQLCVWGHGPKAVDRADRPCVILLCVLHYCTFHYCIRYVRELNLPSDVKLYHQTTLTIPECSVSKSWDAEVLLLRVRQNDEEGIFVLEAKIDFFFYILAGAYAALVPQRTWARMVAKARTGCRGLTAPMPLQPGGLEPPPISLL